MKRVEGKAGIITGSGQGIGRATALMLAREGAKVVVAEIKEENGQETVKLIKAEGGEAIFVHVDVTKEDAVKNMVKVAVNTYGKLDFLDNNAGHEQPAMPVIEVTEEIWDNLLALNLKAHWLCIKHVIPEMLKGGGGSIVNIASGGGIVAMPTVAPYCAAKAGVINLTKNVALEYVTKGIRVNAVAPGFVDTPMADRFSGGDEKVKEQMSQTINPIGRLGKPEEIAAMVLFLVSDESSFCTGACFCVDGGMTCD